MARISPSRNPLHCGLWVPGGRTEPFFPLCPRRQTGTTQMRTAPGIPSSGRGPCAWSGIIRGQSQAFDKSLHGFWYGNSRVALFVGLPFYNTVVLCGCGSYDVALCSIYIGDLE